MKYGAKIASSLPGGMPWPCQIRRIDFVTLVIVESAYMHDQGAAGQLELSDRIGEVQ